MMLLEKSSYALIWCVSSLCIHIENSFDVNLQAAVSK